MKNLCVFLTLLFASPLLAVAQSIELNGGYAHISGDNGLDGFDVGAAWWAWDRVSFAFDYDSAWDTSRLGVSELTQTGAIVTKSHLQDFLVGPRISFRGVLKDKKTFVPHLWPFAEAQFGGSHLSQSLENQTTNMSQSASDSAFSWMVGGGADYRIASHWMARFKIDFLRTHFGDAGQSRARLGLGIAYTFGERGAKQAAEAKAKADAELAAAEAQNKAMEEAKCEECKKQAREEAAQAEAEAAEVKRKADAELAAAEAQKKTMEQADREKQALRARLLEEFNRVLPTTDTSRGLVVNMGDVLFDAGKSNLRPEAREALAKLSGIVLNYPSLRLTIEGHDNTGSEVSQTMSGRRANAVRDYLVKQGLDASSLSAQGLGMNNPVADNGTAEGRQKNRRVEIIVSGEVIGTQIGH
jgi:outer membrane protein OmpA-like peptidoglycan-associated protein